ILRGVSMGTLNGLKRALKSLVFYSGLAATAALIYWLGLKYPLEFDWTAENRNTLSSASQKLLQDLEGPIEIVAYASNTGGLRDKIRTAIDRFRRFKADLSLEFVNPDEEPEAVRKLGIRVDGELIIHYQSRSENLQTLDEAAISNALFRLSQADQRWIVFLSGHGERSPTGSANHDLGQFGTQLENKGYRLLELQGNLSGTIPDNASLLVIANPLVDLLPGEMDAILDYIHNGGNLLWLRDPDGAGGLDSLSRLLGIDFLPGVVVDAGSRAYGIDNPAFVTMNEYPPHRITEGIRSISLFPKSGAIEAVVGGPFQSSPILRSTAQSWSERGPIQGHLQFNPEQSEKQGPLTLGLALTRTLDDQEQHILVIGDGDFLSNSYLGNGINLDLGLNMIQWLTETDNSIDIPARFGPDQSLDLSPSITAALGFVFLVAIPALLVFSGLIIHRKRQRS
ncbi:MAG: GldG family protein, partial [Gammaproteobacteria bacterium]